MTTHKYAQLTPEERQEVTKNFLIDSWSYSKVEAFARNEKGFEMTYIYREKMRFSSTTVAGMAYHEALRHFFTRYQQGEMVDIVALEAVAFEYIDELHFNTWKVQKTTPTVEDCQQKAIKTSTALIRNFYAEISLYLEEVAEVLSVEYKLTEFLTINGVDVPLPCSMVVDLVIRAHDGRIIIIDHKSKSAHSEEQELRLSIGKQAITYVNGYETNTGSKVDEVWFIENKYSENRDKSKKQLNLFAVKIDKDTRRLYEALLYEPLRRMIQAVSDPDYVYLINEADNYIDKAEIHNFWCKTQIAEIEEFNVPAHKKELISKRLKKIRDASIATVTPQVIRNFKRNASEFIQYDLSNTDMTTQEKIEHVLRTFGIVSKVAHTLEGHSSATHLIDLSAGTSIKSVHARRLDIANAIDVRNVRIMNDLMVYQGRSYVAIESEKPRTGMLMWDASKQNGMRIPIGVNNFGDTLYWNFENQSTPHMLVGGGTGSGKSVFIKSTLEFVLTNKDVNVVIFDPKHEFKQYASPTVSVYNDIEDIEVIAEMMVDEMNDRVKSNSHKWTFVIFDEFTDAYMNARSGKQLDVHEMVLEGVFKNGLPKMKRKVAGKKNSLQENMQMLLQKGRSSGFRIMMSTQRADAKVIDGNAKVNMPVQVCFLVNRSVDSRVILDEIGAEALTGHGDGLLRSPEYPSIERFQAFFKE